MCHSWVQTIVYLAYLGLSLQGGCWKLQLWPKRQFGKNLQVGLVAFCCDEILAWPAICALLVCWAGAFCLLAWCCAHELDAVVSIWLVLKEELIATVDAVLDDDPDCFNLFSSCSSFWSCSCCCFKSRISFMGSSFFETVELTDDGVLNTRWKETLLYV